MNYKDENSIIIELGNNFEYIIQSELYYVSFYPKSNLLDIFSQQNLVNPLMELTDKNFDLNHFCQIKRGKIIKVDVNKFNSIIEKYLSLKTFT